MSTPSKYSNPFIQDITPPEEEVVNTLQEGENDHALDDWDIETECHQERQAFYPEYTEVDICLDRKESE